nr:MAG TPA: hypothetical protein [Caudoviricetes sp.]
MILLLPRQENYIIHPAKTQFDKGVFFVPFFRKGMMVYDKKKSKRIWKCN